MKQLEREILGLILLLGEEAMCGLQLLPGDFSADAHAKIYEVMLALYTAGDCIDGVTVRRELADASQLQSVGGDEYLLNLTDVIPTSTGLHTRAKIIREAAAKRKEMEPE